MKVTSLRYLDAKFHYPSPKIKKNSQKYQRTVGYPSTSWASCTFTFTIIRRKAEHCGTQGYGSLTSSWCTSGWSTLWFCEGFWIRDVRSQLWRWSCSSASQWNSHWRQKNRGQTLFCYCCQLQRLYKKEAQLLQRNREMLRVIGYFAKSLKVTQGNSKWHCWV